MNNSVSVIIPTYNRAHFICECVEALFDQTVPASEIIVVNDGSTDNTREVLAPYSDKIIYLEKPNGGKASALNMGLAHASGEFIWICDDDDLSLPDALEIHFDAFVSNPAADFTYSGYYLGIPDAKTGELQISETFTPFKGTSKSLFLSFAMGASGSGVGFMSQQGMLVRKSCYDDVGPFDETLFAAEDLEMNLRLCRLFQGCPIDRQTFIIRRHPGSRGPYHSTYSYSEREQKLWIAAQEVFLKLYKTTSLEAFLDDPNLTKNEINWKGDALINRAQVFARRQLSELVFSDLAELYEQILQGNIKFNENLARGILLIEKTFKDALLPTEAKIVQNTLWKLLASPASTKQLRSYLARYFYWKGIEGLRDGKPNEFIMGFGKSLGILINRYGSVTRKLSLRK